MTDQENKIYERLGGLVTSVEALHSDIEATKQVAMDASQGVAVLQADMAALKEQVSRSNPVWTFIFRSMDGYGNLVATNSFTKGGRSSADIVLVNTKALEDVKAVGELTKDLIPGQPEQPKDSE